MVAGEDDHNNKKVIVPQINQAVAVRTLNFSCVTLIMSLLSALLWILIKGVKAVLTLATLSAVYYGLYRVAVVSSQQVWGHKLMHLAGETSFLIVHYLDRFLIYVVNLAIEYAPAIARLAFF